MRGEHEKVVLCFEPEDVVAQQRSDAEVEFPATLFCQPARASASRSATEAASLKSMSGSSGGDGAWTSCSVPSSLRLVHSASWRATAARTAPAKARG